METAIPPREETGSKLSARLLEVIAHADFEVLRSGQTVFHAHVHLVPKRTAATGLMMQPGLVAVDRTGLAERIRSRLAAARS